MFASKHGRKVGSVQIPKKKKQFICDLPCRHLPYKHPLNIPAPQSEPTPSISIDIRLIL